LRVVEVLEGLAPNYISFSGRGRRCLIGMGGEWGVGASLAMERSATKLRGCSDCFRRATLLAISCCRLFCLCISALGLAPLFFIADLPALLAANWFASKSRNRKSGKNARSDSWGRSGRAVASQAGKAFHLLTLL